MNREEMKKDLEYWTAQLNEALEHIKKNALAIEKNNKRLYEGNCFMSEIGYTTICCYVKEISVNTARVFTIHIRESNYTYQAKGIIETVYCDYPIPGIDTKREKSSYYLCDFREIPKETFYNEVLPSSLRKSFKQFLNSPKIFEEESMEDLEEFLEDDEEYTEEEGDD